jgi:hypothetical protein
MDATPVFSIGKASTRPLRRVKKFVDVPEAFVSVDFLKPIRTWLLIPKATLNAFQILSLDQNFPNLFTELNAVQEFKLMYPEGSFQLTFAMTAYSTKMEYADIVESIESVQKKNRQIRFQMKRLVLAFRIRRLETVNTDDIITLEPIKKAVYIHRLNLAKTYVFEARSLLQDMTRRLLINEDFFLDPHPPRNVLTNEFLTYSELCSVHKQMKAHGVTNWIMESFAATGFDLSFFKIQFEIPLQLHLLSQAMRSGDEVGQDLLIDFMLSEYRYHIAIGIPSETLLVEVAKHYWQAPLIQRWRDQCQAYWECDIRRLDLHLSNTCKNRIHKVTRNLCRLTSELKGMSRA